MGRPGKQNDIWENIMGKHPTGKGEDKWREKNCEGKPR